MHMDTSPHAQSDHPIFHPFLATHYPAFKARFPAEGRRRWRLRVADAFWNLSPGEKNAYLSAAAAAPRTADDGAGDADADDDPLDDLSGDAPGLGVLVRTDYSNETAWQAFYQKLQEGEAGFAAERPSEDDPMVDDSGADPSSAAAADAEDGMEQDQDQDGEEDDEDQDEDAAPAIFTIIDAPPADRARFANISNLAALRLLNDVDVRRAPAPAPGTKRIRPPNRLVDHGGFQEVYTGKHVWIYDAKSNVDQCVRLVSQQGAQYGTATADSWRARVGHICELQVNLASGAMTIDFGGLDRWDCDERARNLEEAARPVG